jgi:hypothetical protein
MTGFQVVAVYPLHSTFQPDLNRPQTRFPDHSHKPGPINYHEHARGQVSQ